VITDRIIML